MTKWNILALVILVSIQNVTMAQDAVFLYRPDGKQDKESGRITAADPDGVTIDGTKVPAASIRKITIGRIPSALDRAHDSFENGQYADCLQQLAKLNPIPSEPLLAADVEFMKAYSNARISLMGGNVAPEIAVGQVQGFLNKYPNSFHLYPAREIHGRLIFAMGKPDAAAPEFEKLRRASWTEHRLKGLYYSAKMQELLGKPRKAVEYYDALLAETGRDDLSQSFQAVAKIEKIKINGIAGDAAAAIASLKKMTGGDAENAMLFGSLYNAMGSLYQSKGDLKNASMSFLKTQLIYGNAPEVHAEALYQLSKIWPGLNKNDRANQAQEILRSTYRNSYWSRQ